MPFKYLGEDIKFVPINNENKISLLKQIRKLYATDASKPILDKHLDILLNSIHEEKKNLNQTNK